MADHPKRPFFPYRPCLRPTRRLPAAFSGASLRQQPLEIGAEILRFTAPQLELARRQSRVHANRRRTASEHQYLGPYRAFLHECCRYPCGGAFAGLRADAGAGVGVPRHDVGGRGRGGSGRGPCGDGPRAARIDDSAPRAREPRRIPTTGWGCDLAARAILVRRILDVPLKSGKFPGIASFALPRARLPFSVRPQPTPGAHSISRALVASARGVDLIHRD